MPADTIVPGEIALAVGSLRPEFAHALGRRIRSGETEIPVEQVAGLAHTIGELIAGIDEKNRRIESLESAADDAAELLEAQESHARALAAAVTKARADLQEARGDGF